MKFTDGRWTAAADAADYLGITARALRSRLRRAPKKDEGFRTLVLLGGGLVATKVSCRWLVWLPPPPIQPVIWN